MILVKGRNKNKSFDEVAELCKIHLEVRQFVEFIEKSERGILR